MAKIIKNATSGYGYKYATLSDIVEQGYELPKMKTGTDNGKDYIYYKDEEGWQRGAEIVIPENIINKEGKAKMNSAQRYLSALTFAKRGTALMALCLATADDVDIENSEEIFDEPLPIDTINKFKKLYKQQEQDKIMAYYKVSRVEELSIDILNKYINDRDNNG